MAPKLPKDYEQDEFADAVGEFKPQYGYEAYPGEPEHNQDMSPEDRAKLKAILRMRTLFDKE